MTSICLKYHVVFCFAGLLGLSLVPTATVRSSILGWLAWSFYFGATAYIGLSNSETFALDTVRGGKTFVVVGIFVFGLSFYWLRLCHAEFLRSMTTPMSIVMAFWTAGSEDGNMMHALVFNVVVHSTSMLVLVAVSDRAERAFSVEWIHATVIANAPSIAKHDQIAA